MWKFFAKASGLVVAILVVLTAQVVLGDATKELQTLFDDEWEFRLRDNPTFATSLGDRRYNDRLEDVSLRAFEDRLEHERRFLDRLLAIDRETLSAVDRVNFDVFRRLKEDRIREYEFRTYLMPITNRSGFHVSFPELRERVPLKTVEDYENYTKRLAGFSQYVDDHIALMREGMRTGLVLPRIVLEGVAGTIEPHIVDDPRESLLYRPFAENPEGIDSDDWARIVDDGERAIRESVIPGYRAFLEFMVGEYLPSAREDIAAASLPEGRAFYEHRVLRFTTLRKSPEEIHQLGHSEVERIRAEMQEVIESVGFEGGFSDFVDFLRTDERFYVSTPDALMKEVAFVLKRMDGELPGLFKTLPRMPYGMKKVPDYIAPKTTTAYYNGPAGDGTRAGFYFVNTYDLKSRPTYEIEALSLHEAVPGHHLQIAIQQELEDIPNFRRFSGFTAFSEGWALYAERLGLECGFYEDPYSNFGRLTYEMWRACRLVVDTGMHYLGWTRQQAIDFMAENSALTIHNITTEVDRYISWPGQALAYKMGELKIRELRTRAEAELGPKFDVREFHDVVLGSGAVPLDILEANVDAWIADER